MIDLDSWLERYLRSLKAAFGDRLRFVGLQGSYGRGEAGEGSDIDPVVVLDTLGIGDIETYRAVLDTLEHRELICGFFSGYEELLRWEPSDLFQFCRDTTPLFGTLDEVLAKVSAGDVERAVRAGACNLYHGCVHNMLFERDADVLRGLYKTATFVIRAAVFRRTGRFCRTLGELNERADEEERAIVSAYGEMTRGVSADFTELSRRLFVWAQKIIAEQ